jgi:urease gamma subunit
MELTPREKDKLLIFTAALLAEHVYGTRGHAPLFPEGTSFGAYIPQICARGITWN